MLWAAKPKNMFLQVMWVRKIPTTESLHGCIQMVGTVGDLLMTPMTPTSLAGRQTYTSKPAVAALLVSRLKFE